MFPIKYTAKVKTVASKEAVKTPKVIATAVAKHVRMDGKGQRCQLTSPLDNAADRILGEWAFSG